MTPQELIDQLSSVGDPPSRAKIIMSNMLTRLFFSNDPQPGPLVLAYNNPRKFEK